jgi:hypothetical protein
VCKFEDLIDKSPLVELKELIDKGDQNGYVRLLQESISPKIRNDKTISFTAWNFNVPGTVYSEANSNDIVNGWDLLTNQNIPLISYSKGFYTTSLSSWLSHDPKDNVDVDEDTVINNILEPESLEILRLSYWVNKCKQIMKDKVSFETKLGEVRSSLKFQNETQFKERLNRKLTIFGRIMKDIGIPYWERDLHARELVCQLETLRSNISSYVPEFMLAALTHEAGFETNFIPSSEEEKKCDLLVRKLYKVEVKTFLDKSEKGRRIEDNLEDEIKGTLKRSKAIRDINESLAKKAEIIFMFLTFSSLSIGFAKYTFEKNMKFPLSESLIQSISLAEQNRLPAGIEQIPIVVFVTWIDVISCNYKISSHMVPYPIKRKNENELEADPEKLEIKLSIN